MSFKSLILCSALLMPMTFARADFASAHAYPVNVSPADGSTIAQPPREVRVQFTEGVELEFSRIDVKNAGGEKVTQGTLRKIANDSLAIDLKPLAPGSYIIEWQVLSVDTHITEGRLCFTVKLVGR